MIDVFGTCAACDAPLRPQDFAHCGPCRAVLSEWSITDVRTAMGEAFRERNAAEHERLLRILVLLLGLNERRRSL